MRLCFPNLAGLLFPEPGGHGGRASASHLRRGRGLSRAGAAGPLRREQKPGILLPEEQASDGITVRRERCGEEGQAFMPFPSPR